MKNKTIYLQLLLVLCSLNFFAQKLERPFILVKNAERSEILKKIDSIPWAKQIYSDLKKSTDKQVLKFYQNPKSYLKNLPFNWSKAEANQFPPFLKTDHIENGKHRNLDNATEKEWKPAALLIEYLQVALDCGYLYYITQEEKYAYVASSILYSFTKSVQKSKMSSWKGRGGLLFPYDGFREVRVIGYRLPLIYDFVASYLKNEGKVFDIIKNQKVNFPLKEAQNVFKTYANITVNYGQTGSNHSVLESPSLVYNALAM
ncbi:hypothetical protein, partial [uncultured Polaribacter sp.]